MTDPVLGLCPRKHHDLVLHPRGCEGEVSKSSRGDRAPLSGAGPPFTLSLARRRALCRGPVGANCEEKQWHWVCSGAGHRSLWVIVLVNAVTVRAGVWVEVTQVQAASQRRGGLGSGEKGALAQQGEV